MPSIKIQKRVAFLVLITPNGYNNHWISFVSEKLGGFSGIEVREKTESIKAINRNSAIRQRNKIRPTQQPRKFRERLSKPRHNEHTQKEMISPAFICPICGRVVMAVRALDIYIRRHIENIHNTQVTL